jgi:hypothetical protein
MYVCLYKGRRPCTVVLYVVPSLSRLTLSIVIVHFPFKLFKSVRFKKLMVLAFQKVNALKS